MQDLFYTHLKNTWCHNVKMSEENARNDELNILTHQPLFVIEEVRVT
jgi:hypothetical protein